MCRNHPRLTGTQQASSCGLWGSRRRQDLVAYGDVGEEGREVETRSSSDRRQDGRGGIRGERVQVVRQADRRAQVALVMGDTGVYGWGDEGGWFGGRDDEGLWTSPALELSLSVLFHS